MTQGVPSDDLAATMSTELASGLLDTFAAMFAGMRRDDAVRIATGDVTWAQHHILEAILANGRPMRVSDLAADISLSVASTTVVTRRLEHQRVVRRISDPTDHRSVLIVVTTKGAAAHRNSVEAAQNALAARLSRLGAPELQALGDALPALSRLIQLAAVDLSYGVASQFQTDMSPRG